MSKNTEITSKETDPREPRNAFSLFPKFKFEFPFLKPKGGSKTEDDGRRESMLGEQARRGMETPKPVTVRFPNAKIAVPPPEVVENEETGEISNPIILWQVYALGGFLVLRWLWARWNEKKTRKQDSDDDAPHSAE